MEQGVLKMWHADSATTRSTDGVSTSVETSTSLGEAAPIGPIDLVVVQPTPFCNINCSYCYLPGRANPHRMTDHILRASLQFALLSSYVSASPQVIWHSGEPLAASLAFFRQAFAVAESLIREANSQITVKHSIQTNGTLLTQAWCELFLRYGVHIGVSLDGPKEWHDLRRRTRAGGGTHDDVMRGVKLLAVNQVPFSVITVLGENSLNDPDRLFAFFLRNEIRDVAFNVEEITGCNAHSIIQSDSTCQKYKSFLARFFELAKGEDVSIRELRVGRARILATSGYRTNPLVSPFRILSIDFEGNFSTYCPELLSATTAAYPVGFTVGNVTTHTIDQALLTPQFVRISSEVRNGVDKCRRSCEYFDLCGGGAPSNKLFESGTFDCAETAFCRLTRKTAIDVVLESLESSLGPAARR